MAVATKIQLPYLEDTGLDGKNLYTPKECTERLRHYIKRIYNIDIKPILTDDTVPTGDPWNTKEPDIRQDFIWGAGPSASEIITKGEFNTDPDTVTTDKLLQLFKKYYMPKRNTYHSRGDFFWAKQEENETPEEHWKKLITLEKNCEFKDIKQEDILISKFITSITDKKLREKLIREKTLNLKTTVELITQNSYDRRHKQSTIPAALSKDKEIKEEPIQKIQPKFKTDKYGDRTTQKKNNCGFCGQQNWNPQHTCPAKNAKCNNCQKMGHFARVCRSKQNRNDQRRINYLEETSSEEEESEPEEIRQITQINKILPDNNDHYGVEMIINGEKQKFIINTGSPVTIMPYDQKIHKTKNNQTNERKIPGRKQKRNQIHGKNMGNRGIQRGINQTTDANHQKKRYHTTTGSKLAKTTANNNKQNLIEQRNQPIRKRIQKILQTLQHQPHDKRRRDQNTNKTGMLPNTTKSTTDTLPFARRCKKRAEPTNRIRTLRKTRNNRRRLLRIARSNYGKERQIRQNCTRRQKTER